MAWGVLQADDSEVGMHAWRMHAGPTSLAASAARSGASGGGLTRREGSHGDVADSEPPATSPPLNATQTPEDQRDGSTEGEDPAAAVMGMAMQRLPSGVDGVVGAPLEVGVGDSTQDSATQDSPTERVGRPLTSGTDEGMMNALDLHLASMRSDGSQLLGMPPSFGMGGVSPMNGGGAMAVPTRDAGADFEGCLLYTSPSPRD